MPTPLSYASPMPRDREPSPPYVPERLWQAGIALVVTVVLLIALLPLEPRDRHGIHGWVGETWPSIYVLWVDVAPPGYSSRSGLTMPRLPLLLKWATIACPLVVPLSAGFIESAALRDRRAPWSLDVFASGVLVALFVLVSAAGELDSASPALGVFCLVPIAGGAVAACVECWVRGLSTGWRKASALAVACAFLYYAMLVWFSPWFG